MPVAYDSLLETGENLRSLTQLKIAVAEGVGDNFALVAILTQVSGSLPDVAGVVGELTVYGEEDEVNGICNEAVIERGALYGEGHTTFSQLFRGQEAGEKAGGYAVYMLAELNKVDTGN